MSIRRRTEKLEIRSSFAPWSRRGCVICALEHIVQMLHCILDLSCACVPRAGGVSSQLLTFPARSGGHHTSHDPPHLLSAFCQALALNPMSSRHVSCSQMYQTPRHVTPLCGYQIIPSDYFRQCQSCSPLKPPWSLFHDISIANCLAMVFVQESISSQSRRSPRLPPMQV